MLSIIFLASVLLPANGQITECPSIQAPLWGEISCTVRTSLGSVCTLSCQEFYDLDGTTDKSKDVICQADGSWSADTDFGCTPVRCLPPLQTPTNGDLICSATNLAQSLCVYFCKDHYDLAGVDTDRNAYAVCRDDEDGDEFGEWVQVDGDVVFPPTFPPVCEQIKCPSAMDAPVNGKVICSANDFSGSTCVFYCDDGYRFKDTNEPVLFSNCRDDGNYDNVGEWTMPDVPKCEIIPGCGKAPEIKGVMFTCDNDHSIIGDKCNAKCVSDMEEITEKTIIACNGRLKWESEGGGRLPKCTKCKRVKDIHLMALIHDFENNQKQFEVAAKTITNIIKVMKRKYKLNPTVRVNRYADDVNEATEVYTTDFQIKRDRQKIETIPFSSGKANTEMALRHIDVKLNTKDAVLAAFILTNDLADYDNDTDELAAELRARGVMIFTFSIPQMRRIKSWWKEDMVALSGSESMFFPVTNVDIIEEHRSEVAEQINKAAMKMGCMAYGNKD